MIQNFACTVLIGGKYLQNTYRLRSSIKSSFNYITYQRYSKMISASAIAFSFFEK